MINLNVLNTERRNPKTVNIDQASTVEILTLMNEEDATIAATIQKEIPNIAKLVDATSAQLAKGGRVIYMGAGTSGRLGVLDASECPPTFGVSSELFQGVMAGGQSAMFKAKEGAEDSTALAVEDLQRLQVTPNDMVVGLAASGRTPYVIGAIEYANEVGATTGSISCVKDSEVSKVAQFPVEVVTGAEVLTGSTRMKAGTAQKLVLNMLSTSCMIKAGKVYQNLMIDVQPTNDKLVVRAKSIIREALSCSDEEAADLFEASDHNVKLAIVMGISGSSKEEAIQVLEDSNGNVASTVRKLMEEK